MSDLRDLVRDLPEAVLSSAILNDLLIRWHQWRMQYRAARGFNGRAAVLGDYRSSRQYDDCNGALDEAIEDRIMAQVEHEICELPRQQQIALAVQARALVYGCEVWMSPRLPSERAEREELLAMARASLVRRLLSSGVM